MTIIITPKTDLASIKRWLSNLVKPKGFDAKKYAGKIKLNLDPVDYQRQMRDEWD
jgi:hypothetical protein